jgi:GNAT superfamily N-acetyltransferase
MAVTELTIRAFEPSDLPHLEEIRRLAFEPVFASFREIVGPAIAEIAFATAEAEQSEHLKKLCDPGSPKQVFVAALGSNPVGFVAVSLDRAQKTGEIGLNAVHPDHAGQGIGTALYDYALDFMRLEGMLVATVGTGGDDSHAPARRAYEKAGFGPAIPSLWMYRAL